MLLTSLCVILRQRMLLWCKSCPFGAKSAHRTTQSAMFCRSVHRSWRHRVVTSRVTSRASESETTMCRWLLTATALVVMVTTTTPRSRDAGVVGVSFKPATGAPANLLHLAVDESSGFVYVGAVNHIYQLSAERLQMVSVAVTGNYYLYYYHYYHHQQQHNQNFQRSDF